MKYWSWVLFLALLVLPFTAYAELPEPVFLDEEVVCAMDNSLLCTAWLADMNSPVSQCQYGAQGFFRGSLLSAFHTDIISVLPEWSWAQGAQFVIQTILENAPLMKAPAAVCTVVPFVLRERDAAKRDAAKEEVEG